jgi:AcrR family transcriptional regulator
MGKVSMRAAKQAEIMKIGATLFKEVGYENATVDEIAKRANIDRATLYYYFKGKQDIFREMVNVATSTNVTMAEDIAALKEAPDIKLRKLMLALFESYQNHYPYLYVYIEQDFGRLTGDDSAWSSKLIKLNDRFNKAVAKIIREGRKDGIFLSSGSDKIVAAGILGMCNWSHRWYKPDGRMNAQQIASVFADMVLSGLCPGATNGPKSAQ